MPSPLPGPCTALRSGDAATELSLLMRAGCLCSSTRRYTTSCRWV